MLQTNRTEQLASALYRAERKISCLFIVGNGAKHIITNKIAF